MSHDDSFAAFRERKQAERDAAGPRVTWRRASWGAGETKVAGWSGLGPNGQLLYVAENARPRDPEAVFHGYGYSYGRVDGSRREYVGDELTATAAKRAAEGLLS